MRTRYVILAFLLASMVRPAAADDYPRNPGADVLHYAFRLELSDATDEILGQATVSVRFLADGAQPPALDLIGATQDSTDGASGMKVTAVLEDGSPVRFDHLANRIRIQAGVSPKAGENRTYTVVYQGIAEDGLVVADNKHGDRTFSADNWPDKTRFWLPTLDHPYDKATCEFLITAPDHYQVVANGLKIEETNLPAGLRLTHWKQSVPISTWLMVISVGRYAVEYIDDYQGISVQTWVFPQDREAGFFDFARARAPLEFFSTHIGPYAYEKLANVQVTAPVGATEAATNVFYNQDFVKGDRSREWVVAHEVAHHWWGNSVTEDDWDHVWLSEGFATYFTLLFAEYSEGRDRFVEGLESARERVFAFDADDPAYRIVHQDLADMSKVTSSQTYQKGAWVLHMLRGIMGDEPFWDGIREYYRRYRDSNCSTDDFRAVMEEFHGQSLSWFFDQWLYRGGKLELAGTWSYDEASQKLSVELDQVQEGDLFRMPVQIGISVEEEPRRIETVLIEAVRNQYTLPLEARPSSVVLDPDTWLLMDGALEPRTDP